jgi:hypothetical protein
METVASKNESSRHSALWSEHCRDNARPRRWWAAPLPRAFARAALVRMHHSQQDESEPD